MSSYNVLDDGSVAEKESNLVVMLGRHLELYKATLMLCARVA